MPKINSLNKNLAQKIKRCNSLVFLTDTGIRVYRYIDYFGITVVAMCERKKPHYFNFVELMRYNSKNQLILI